MNLIDRSNVSMGAILSVLVPLGLLLGAACDRSSAQADGRASDANSNTKQEQQATEIAPQVDEVTESKREARKVSSNKAEQHVLASDSPKTKTPLNGNSKNHNNATASNPKPLTPEMSPKQMYIAYCGACHSVDLVESQRLSRADWAWVMTDMVEEYGGAWIKPNEQEIIIDYLAEHFGPQ